MHSWCTVQTYSCLDWACIDPWDWTDFGSILYAVAASAAAYSANYFFSCHIQPIQPDKPPKQSFSGLSNYWFCEGGRAFDGIGSQCRHWTECDSAWWDHSLLVTTSSPPFLQITSNQFWKKKSSKCNIKEKKKNGLIIHIFGKEYLIQITIAHRVFRPLKPCGFKI